MPLWHGLVAGAASGAAARLLTYPTDTLKARAQLRGALPSVGAASPRSTLAAARAALAAEGLRGLYRGCSAVLLGTVPANLAYFGGYELGRRLLPREWAGGHAAAADAATGVLAQLLAGVVYTPIDIVKERMQTAGLVRAAYSSAGTGATAPQSALAAFSALSAGGAGLRGMMRGYWATNAVWLPWNALYVAGYEAARGAAADALSLQGPEALPAPVVAACSATAAAAAAVITHPADVVKTRLQVLSGTPASACSARLSALSLARQQLANEGMASFWAGLTPRLLTIAPGCALSWALYESIKGALARADDAVWDAEARTSLGQAGTTS